LGDEYLAWDSVEGAVKYNLYCNDIYLDSTTDTWYDVTPWINVDCTDVVVYAEDSEGRESQNPSDPAIFEPWACFTNCGEIPCYEGALLRYPEKACEE